MNKREAFFWFTGFALAWVFWSSAAQAADPLETQVRAAIARTSLANGRVELEFPPWEPPPSFAGCGRAETYVPAGTKLWGRTQIGLRCAEGRVATTLMPIHVRVFATGLATRRALPAGAVVVDEDLEVTEVEASAAPAPLVSARADVLGRVLARALPAGSALRSDAFRTRLAVAAGDMVRIVYAGPGFSISSDGKALASAQEGQSLRVQTEGGRILTGTAKAGRIVELRAAGQ